MTRYDLHTELFLGARWVDVSGDVFARDDIQITRGRASEGSRTDPASCSLTLDNRTGDYSPRNPEGAHYPELGRNTPLRVWVGTPSTGAAGGSTVDTASHVAPSVSSRAADALLFCGWVSRSTDDATGESYTVPASMTLVSEWSSVVGSNMATAYETLTGSGDTGTRTATLSRTSDWAAVSVAVPGRSGAPPTIQETLNSAVNNSSPSQHVTLTTDASTQAGWWMLAIQGWNTGFNNNMPAEPQGTAGGWLPMGALVGGSDGLQPRVRAWVRRINTAGAHTVTFKGDTDAASYANYGWLWVLSNVPDSFARFAGEIASFPPRWDVTASDVTVPVEAAGIMRRLGQAASPLRSAIYRGTTRIAPWAPQVVAYWPMEDGEDAVQLASAVDGGKPMTIIGTPELSANSDFAPASEPIPELGTGGFAGVVAPYTSAVSQWQMQFLLSVPGNGLSGSGQRRLVDVRTDGTARRFIVETDENGTLRLLVYDEVGTQIEDSGEFAFTLNGKPVRFALEVDDNGSGGVDYAFATVRPGASVGLAVNGSISNSTAGTVQSILIGGRAGEDLDRTAIGHVSVRDGITSIFEFGSETNAYRGEAAGRRIERLCREQDVPFTAQGDLDETAALGPQGVDTLLDLLREAAGSDGGILAERRAALGLHYRTHAGLYNQASVIDLDYTAGEVSPPLEPVEDDQNLANDVTAKRDGGSATRAVKATGPLSVTDIGRYDASYTLSLHTDEQTRGQAGWRLHLGTINRLRYPLVTVNLNERTSLHAPVARIAPGDRFTIQNLPDFLPPGAADLEALGISEILNSYSWVVEFNTAPAERHKVGELDSATFGRLATAGSSLNEDLTSTETSISVTTDTGQVWTTDAASIPFDIEVGGERMTVTAVSGATSPQTFTVIRSVNGVTKTHASGDAVALARPLRLALGQSGASLGKFESLLP